MISITHIVDLASQFTCIFLLQTEIAIKIACITNLIVLIKGKCRRVNKYSYRHYDSVGGHLRHIVVIGLK